MRQRRWFCLAWVCGLSWLSLGVAQENAVQLTYEVASIRPAAPDAPDGFVDPLPGGIGYNARNIPLKDMLSVMYRIPRRQILGGPEWLSTERFDVQVRADHRYSIDDLHLMFQNLLADRFRLKVHKENRIGPVYVLTVAKSGLKMIPVDVGTERNIPITEGPDSVSRGNRVPMNYLCFWLGQNLQSDQRPVLDRTGLTGTYDFSLRFRPQLPPDISGEDESPDLQELPSIFEALRDQLGLELVPQRGPVETLVIDHVEKPTAN